MTDRGSQTAEVMALTNGARQVLILRAGFDTRVYRMRGIATARVFEIDLSPDDYRARYFGDAARSMKGYSFIAPPTRDRARGFL